MRSVIAIGAKYSCAILVCFSLILLMIPSAFAEVRIVGGKNAQFQSIQSAINAGRSGDTIQVNKGIYTEDLIIRTSLTLKGLNKPIIRGSGTTSVIRLLAPNSTIQGFTIEHSGSDLQKEDSGILIYSGYNRIEANELRNVHYGIYLFGSQHNSVRKNIIRGRAELDIGDRGAGLHLWNSPNNVIDGNYIVEARDGLYIQSSSGNQIRNNRVSNLRYGVHYMFSDSNQFEENIFSNNQAGAAIMYSKKIQFRRNAFMHNRGFTSFGILLQACDECSAESNTIIDNGVGIFMEAVRLSSFRKNLIAANNVALQMFTSSERNTFSENNFVENLSPLQLIGKKSSTMWEERGRGNYWSDYDGYDLNDDGIGDVPHKIQNLFEYMEGNYPRLRLYLYSPAAHALIAAEKAFPVIQVTHELDNAPLLTGVPVSFLNDSKKSSSAKQISLFTASLIICGLALITLLKGRQ